MQMGKRQVCRIASIVFSFLFLTNPSRSIKVSQDGLPSPAASHGGHGNQYVLDVDAGFDADRFRMRLNEVSKWEARDLLSIDST